MRDIQPGSLHIHLVFTAGTRLIIVALGIINLRCLKPMQKLRASNNVFNVIAKSRTLYISPFRQPLSAPELLLDLYLVVVYKAYLRYLTTFHDTLIVSPDSSVLFSVFRNSYRRQTFHSERIIFTHFAFTNIADIQLIIDFSYRFDFSEG